MLMSSHLHIYHLLPVHVRSRSDRTHTHYFITSNMKYFGGLCCWDVISTCVFHDVTSFWTSPMAAGTRLYNGAKLLWSTFCLQCLTQCWPACKFTFQVAWTSSLNAGVCFRYTAHLLLTCLQLSWTHLHLGSDVAKWCCELFSCCGWAAPLNHAVHTHMSYLRLYCVHGRSLLWFIRL